MRKITISLSYHTEDVDEQKADALYQEFQKRYLEVFPDAKLQGVCIAKEAAVLTDNKLKAVIAPLIDEIWDEVFELPDSGEARKKINALKDVMRGQRTAI